MTATRSVVLGVTGSIAAYKAGELIRLLRKAGVDVQVILTRAGAEFITPTTLGTLSERPVTTGMFDQASGGSSSAWGQAGARDGDDRQGIGHIRASRESGLIIVAPATGNILGKVAHGIADDALSTAIMASSVPVLFAPAMNTMMWESAAVRENVRILMERGFLFVQPGTGDLACGEMGTGRMARPEEIADAALRLLAGRARGPRILVTAGRTEEAIDPVRYISNRSSGKMGVAVAAAARDLGYQVTLLAGAVSCDLPYGVETVRAHSAEEMAAATRRLHPDHEILVMTAAVSDYRPRRVLRRKLESGQKDLSMPLAPTTDILASIRGQRDGKVTVGFALETSGDLARGHRKLAAKGCDLVAWNNPTRRGSEFGGDTNEVVLLQSDGIEARLPLMSKYEVALEILALAARILEAKQTNPSRPGAHSGTPASAKAPRRPAGRKKA